jgi:hypothetical protein
MIMEMLRMQNAFESAFDVMKKFKTYMLPFRYRDKEAARKARIDRLLEERTMHGCGTMWSIVQRGHAFYMQIAPKATIIDPNDYAITTGVPEAFWNIRAMKTGISDAETEKWDKITEQFHKEIGEMLFVQSATSH